MEEKRGIFDAVYISYIQTKRDEVAIFEILYLLYTFWVLRRTGEKGIKNGLCSKKNFQIVSNFGNFFPTLIVDFLRVWFCEFEFGHRRAWFCLACIVVLFFAPANLSKNGYFTILFHSLSTRLPVLAFLFSLEVLLILTVVLKLYIGEFPSYPRSLTVYTGMQTMRNVGHWHFSPFPLPSPPTCFRVCSFCFRVCCKRV